MQAEGSLLAPLLLASLLAEQHNSAPSPNPHLEVLCSGFATLLGTDFLPAIHSMKPH